MIGEVLSDLLKNRPGLISMSAVLLAIVFICQIVLVSNRESMTNDEGFHIYAGYRYWQCGDFGVNPEHPPFAKMTAALPLLLTSQTAPAGACPVADTNKGTGYSASDSWLYGLKNHPETAIVDRLLPMARHAMLVWPLLLFITAYFFTRMLFDASIALVAVFLITFEPTLIAHGGLVTTDMALSAASLLSVAAFFFFQRRPSAVRLVLAGLACGLTLSIKHSGVLILPILVILSVVELADRRSEKEPSNTVKCMRQVLALSAVILIGVGVLWSTYHFRYAARPGDAHLTTSLADFITDTESKENRSLMLRIIPVLAKGHLLPEAYLDGFVDVLSISNPGQSSFLFGHLYPHGVPQYFPSVVLIKTTLGMIVLGIVALFVLLKRHTQSGVAALYLVTPALVWMLAGMVSTLNIGYRHILPVIAPACCLIGIATVQLLRTSRPAVRIALIVLLLAHAVSSLAAFPDELAYGNEVFGGVRGSYRILTDSNNDWGQALPQLSSWLEKNQRGDCWFAYDGFAHPELSGVHCHPLVSNLFEFNDAPVSASTASQPSEVTGTLIVSGLSGSGIEWERPDLNPYQQLRDIKPVAVVGGADVVYQGTFDVSQAQAVNHLVEAMHLNGDGNFIAALPLAELASQAMPTSALAQLEMAKALRGLGQIGVAHEKYREALSIANAQPEWYFLSRTEMLTGFKDTMER
jgi:hypothetical protein